MYDLAEKNRIKLHPTPEKWIYQALENSPMEEAELTNEIAIESRFIDIPHQDPAVRFIAATALVNDFILITKDERMLRSKQIKILK